MNLLDFIKSIVTKTKVSSLEGYSQYALNLYFSKYRNCLFVINALNSQTKLTDKMHYDFLFENIPYGWQKKLEYDDIKTTKDDELIMKRYNVDCKRAKEYLKFITTDELIELRQYYELGGRIGK